MSLITGLSLLSRKFTAISSAFEYRYPSLPCHSRTTSPLILLKGINFKFEISELLISSNKLTGLSFSVNIPFSLKFVILIHIYYTFQPILYLI